MDVQIRAQMSVRIRAAEAAATGKTGAQPKSEVPPTPPPPEKPPYYLQRKIHPPKQLVVRKLAPLFN